MRQLVYNNWLIILKIKFCFTCSKLNLHRKTRITNVFCHRLYENFYLHFTSLTIIHICENRHILPKPRKIYHISPPTTVESFLISSSNLKQACKILLTKTVFIGNFSATLFVYISIKRLSKTLKLLKVLRY